MPEISLPARLNCFGNDEGSELEWRRLMALRRSVNTCSALFFTSERTAEMLLLRLCCLLRLPPSRMLVKVISYIGRKDLIAVNPSE